MTVPINAKQLRASLPEVVERVRKGTRFTVIYRSRPAFQIVPVNEAEDVSLALDDDPLYRARAVGRSTDGRIAADHDTVLYGPMKALFVDTAGWMACADGADPAHSRCCAARDAALETGQTLVTTDFVVDETLTLLRFRLGLAAAEPWWQQVDRSPRLRWERIDSDRFEKARHLFFQYRDKDYSFTDCTSFVMMREKRLTHAITTVRHVRQMGFQVLPGTRSRSPRRPGGS